MDNCHQMASAGGSSPIFVRGCATWGSYIHSYYSEYKSIHSAFICQQKPFDGSYLYSFNDLIFIY